MKKHDVEQGTAEWLKMRAGIPTASEFDAIITPLWKPRTGEGVESYLAKKLAERWLGAPLPSFGGGALEQGKIREEEAIPFFELDQGLTVERVGFVTTDDGRAGCSPDGMLRYGIVGEIGIEIKCPEAHTHVGYLLRGELPKDYAAQVHGSMWVTGAAYWRFMSYRRGFPALLITVPRNEEICDAIGRAVDAFNMRLDKAFDLLDGLEKGFQPLITGGEK